jgi:hypothetical protein
VNPTNSPLLAKVVKTGGLDSACEVISGAALAAAIDWVLNALSTAAVETLVAGAVCVTAGVEADVACMAFEPLDDRIDRAENEPYQPAGSSSAEPLKNVRSSKSSGLASVRRFEMKRLGLDPLLGKCLLPPSRLRCFVMVL